MRSIKSYLLITTAVLPFLLTQCCTSKSEIKDTNKILKNYYPQPSLSPGTAEVTATILKLIKENSKTIGVFKIDTVHGYGPSTRPIGVGSQLNIEFAKNLLKHNENKIPQIFKKDTKHRLLIRSIRSGLKREDANLWQIIIIK